jgi:hypothetical protein
MEAPICNAGTISVGQATATDNCATGIVPTGQAISFDGNPLNPPIPVTNGQAVLGFGTYVIQWNATDGTNPATPVTQQVIVLPKLEANGSFLVDDQANIKDMNGGFGIVLNAGATQTLIGNTSHTGSVTSVASVQLSNQADVVATSHRRGPSAPPAPSPARERRTRRSSFPRCRRCRPSLQ